jgi:hypothetical protein
MPAGMKARSTTQTTVKENVTKKPNGSGKRRSTLNAIEMDEIKEDG